MQEFWEKHEKILVYWIMRMSLFTNVPVKLVMVFISKKFDIIKNGCLIKSKMMYMEGLSLYVDNGYFKF